MRRALVLSALVAFAACADPDEPKKPLPSVDDFMTNVHDDRSCVLDCNPGCQESAKPWTCSALAPWTDIPHDAQCGSPDPPAAKKGACFATDPAQEALVKTSRNGNPVVLPDGRRIAPAGAEWVFDEPDVTGGFPVAAVLFPGGRWLIVNDGGYQVHAVKVVDTTTLKAGGPKPVVSYVKYPPPRGLGYGIAVAPTNVVYVAGGDPDDRVYAFTVDPPTGKLTPDPTKEISLPPGTVGQGIAISPDGRTLLVGQATKNPILAYSLDFATYGQSKGTIDPGGTDVFAVRFDPNDASSNAAYATLWTTPTQPGLADPQRLAQLDVAGLRATTIPVGRAPEDVAFLDARYMVVANALSDTLSIVDRPAAKVVGEVKVGELHGEGPSALAYDAPRRRLYATLSSSNGVAAFDVDLSSGAPVLTPAGVFGTGWWPTSVVVDPADGTVYVTNGKGHGTGTDNKQRSFGDGSVGASMMGSVQAVPFLDAAALAAATRAHAAATDVAKLPGYPTVQCNGAPYDFPIPARPEDGRSSEIKHVFFVVRENKTFDDIMGDVPGVDGDPKLTMAPRELMDPIWGNARKIGAEFTQLDNYYSDAEQSIQGHAWTVFGRTTDYTERRWTIIWGRGEVSETKSPGVGENTTPAEGNIFSILKGKGLRVENMGDLYGLAYRDLQWPGGTTSATVPDTLGACYVAARARVACNTADFTYVWLVNDHTFGLAAGKPNPGLLVSVNDEATGMLLDGISHSPIWKESLVVVVEDDPETGGDHVDLHRSIALFASPWVKRKYVSHGHYDVASIHKLFMHVFGVPYPNEVIAKAPLPLDVFTSTPDFSPYEYEPRGFRDTSCNAAGTAGAQAASRWDFSEPDDQPGLGEQVRAWMRQLQPRAQQQR